MNTPANQRVDEVAHSYLPSRRLDTICGMLYYILVALSLLILFPDWFNNVTFQVLKTSFLLLSLVLFGGFLVNKLYLIPEAERERRKQLLADAFGVVLTAKQTSGYYNNEFPPGLQKLAASVMENSFFGNEILKLMLFSVRIKTFGYLIVWLVAFTVRHESMDVLLWITQVVFSADILAYWLSLECLRSRHKQVYDDLYNHFFHHHDQKSPTASASILNTFASYESAKAAAGILLDSTIFFRENPRLSEEWIKVCGKLSIPTI